MFVSIFQTMFDQEHLNRLSAHLSKKFSIDEDEMRAEIENFNEECEKDCIWIRNPKSSEDCGYNHGVQSSIFKINKEKWQSICDFMEKNKDRRFMTVFRENTDDAKGDCHLWFNLFEMYKGCEVLGNQRKSFHRESFLDLVENRVDNMFIQYNCPLDPGYSAVSRASRSRWQECSKILKQNQEDTFIFTVNLRYRNVDVKIQDILHAMETAKEIELSDDEISCQTMRDTRLWVHTWTIDDKFVCTVYKLAKMLKKKGKK